MRSCDWARVTEGAENRREEASAVIQFRNGKSFAPNFSAEAFENW